MREKFLHCVDDSTETMIRIIMFLLFVFILHKWITAEKHHVTWGANEYIASGGYHMPFSSPMMRGGYHFGAYHTPGSYTSNGNYSDGSFKWD